jgi:hypothetical protein
METRWLFTGFSRRSTVCRISTCCTPRAACGEIGRSRVTARLTCRPALQGGRGDEPQSSDDACCRLSTLERLLFDVTRVGDAWPGNSGPLLRIRRSGDPRPLEPVLEHNRLDLVSLAAVTARAARLAQQGHEACRDCSEALALGGVYERCGLVDRAEACFRSATSSESTNVKAEALYRLGLRLRRDRRYEEAAEIWREVLAWTERTRVPRSLLPLRQFAAEALAIHLEHRRRDLSGARAHALFALEESDARRATGVHHRIARIDRKLAKKKNPESEDPGRLYPA